MNCYIHMNYPIYALLTRKSLVYVYERVLRCAPGYTYGKDNKYFLVFLLLI